MKDFNKLLDEPNWKDRALFAEKQLAEVVWIEVTHNSATHPTSGVPVMVIGGLPYFMDIVDHVPSISTFEPEKINGWMGKQWRPLCSFDYPPEAAIGEES